MNKILFSLALYSIYILNGESFIWPTSSKHKIIVNNHNLVTNTQLMMAKKSLAVARERVSSRFDSIPVTPEEEAEEAELYKLLEEASAQRVMVAHPTTGTIVKGTVIDMDEFGALVEIGGKCSGFMPLAEASLNQIEHVNQVLQVGQEVTSEVIGMYKGTPVLSLRKEQLEQRWSHLLKLKAEDESFETTILSVNKGGAICSAYGMIAFLPGSHFIGLPEEGLVGKSIKVKFLDLSPESGKVVLSQRRAVSDNMLTLKRGDVIEGKVTGLKVYGAFLELTNGLTGLLHISQISYDRIDNLESLFSVGMPIKAMVLDYDKLNTKLALSTKTLEVNPGDMLRNMQEVFANAEETAKKYHEKQLSEKLAREAAAKEIVAGLGGALGLNNNSQGQEGSAGNSADPLLNAAVSIESILASIVGDSSSASSDTQLQA